MRAVGNKLVHACLDSMLPLIISGILGYWETGEQHTLHFLRTSSAFHVLAKTLQLCTSVFHSLSISLQKVGVLKLLMIVLEHCKLWLISINLFHNICLIFNLLDVEWFILLLDEVCGMTDGNVKTLSIKNFILNILTLWYYFFNVTYN